MLAKNVQLIEALQELRAHEQDISFLSPQCQIILGECMQLVPFGSVTPARILHANSTNDLNPFM